MWGGCWLLSYATINLAGQGQKEQTNQHSETGSEEVQR